MSFLHVVKRLLGDRPIPSRTEPEARAELVACMNNVVVPALHAAKRALEEEGCRVEVVESDQPAAGLHVTAPDGAEAYFAVEGRLYYYSAFAFPVLHGREDRPMFPRLRIESNGAAHERDCENLEMDSMRDECLATCHKWMGWSGGTTGES